MAPQPKPLIGLRTYSDDYQRLSGQDTPPAPAMAPIPTADLSPEAVIATAATNYTSEPATNVKSTIELTDSAATQQDVQQVVATYDKSNDDIDTDFHDIGISLHDHDTAAEIEQQITKDTEAHNIDLDTVLTDGNSGAVGAKSQDISFKDEAGQSASDANIIRETKGERFRLLPAIIASIKGWFVHKETVRQAKEAAKPTVINPESRKERLKEAARHSALPTTTATLAPKKESNEADKKAAENDGLFIKDKTAVTAASWSHILDEADTLEEASLENQPEPIETTTPKATPVSEPVDTPKPLVPVTPSEDNNTNLQKETTDSSRWEATSTDETPVVTTPPATPVELPDTSHDTTTTSRPLEEPAERRVYVTLIGSLLIAIALGGSVAYGLYTISTTARTAATPTPESLVTYDNAIGLSAVNPYNFLEEATNTRSETPDTTVVFYPTVTTNEGETLLLDPAGLFGPLNTGMSDPFLRSLTTSSFGNTRDGVSFLVLAANDFDIAFAGMLEWEQHIATDLQPFFGEPTTNAFTDVQFENQDIRVSERLDGTELLYAFTNKNTIIITTDRTALADIKALLQ